MYCLSPGSNYYVRILSTIDRELLKPASSVALHKHSNALVDVLPPEADSSITMLSAGQLFEQTDWDCSVNLIFTVFSLDLGAVQVLKGLEGTLYGNEGKLWDCGNFWSITDSEALELLLTLFVNLFSF